MLMYLSASRKVPSEMRNCQLYENEAGNEAIVTTRLRATMTMVWRLLSGSAREVIPDPWIHTLRSYWTEH